MTRFTMRLSRRRTLRRSLFAAVASALVVATAACQGQTPTTSPTKPPATSTTATTSPDTPPPSDAAPIEASTPVGAKWDWGRIDSYRPYLKSLAGSSTYYEFVWCDVEATQGNRDWATVDKVARLTRELGIHLLIKIRVGMCWATDGEAQFTRGKVAKTESGMPKDLALYQEFIQAATERYSAYGVTHFALENEVNSPSYWGGTPEQLRELVTAGAKAVRAGNPEAKVVDYGLASSTYGYGIADDLLKRGDEAGAVNAYNQYFERRFGTRGDKLPPVSDAAGLRAVLASEQGRRNLGYLALATELAQTKVVDVRQIHFYEKWSSVPLLLSYLKAHTPAGTPIQAWEVGSFWRGADGEESERSDEMVKTLSQLLGGGVEVAIWLPLSVDPTGRNADEPRYGLIDPDGTVREAGKAMSVIADAARDAKPLPVATAGLSGVGYEKDGGSVLFVWGSGVAVKLDNGGKAGAVGEAVDQAGTNATVSVDESPSEIRVSTPVATFLSAQG